MIRIALHTYCISELFLGYLELFASKLEETSQNQKTYSTPRSSDFEPFFPSTRPPGRVTLEPFFPSTRPPGRVTLEQFFPSTRPPGRVTLEPFFPLTRPPGRVCSTQATRWRHWPPGRVSLRHTTWPHSTIHSTKLLDPLVEYHHSPPSPSLDRTLDHVFTVYTNPHSTRQAEHKEEKRRRQSVWKRPGPPSDHQAHLGPLSLYGPGD